MTLSEWEVPITISRDFDFWGLCNLIEELDTLDCYIDMNELEFDIYGNASATVYGGGDFEPLERILEKTEGVEIDYEALREMIAEMEEIGEKAEP